ncbi:hypothetical protein BOTBODRAFT_571108 [Botryobasidium botryosum FD-172 SS1]|uniref:F-box domain-containing protein n=1 Tax=Botryobasidium botryosum (strain FD-172 SS1) TaxID=930990 RepID=A0A067LXZ6_BOTB1|nr:hypothetical protein BOTBODRAFT_571108 [Botryobasidium botryosum FD-172 SS1]
MSSSHPADLPQAAGASAPNSRNLIDRIPAEVLHDIFKALHLSTDWTTPSALRASHVCRVWRQMIHASSIFWSRLDLFVSNAELDRHAAYWLERAGSRPLSINIRLYRTRGDLELHSEWALQLRLIRLRCVLQPTTARWESFSATVPPSLASDFFSGLQGMAPSLKKLNIGAALRNDEEDKHEEEGDDDDWGDLPPPFDIPLDRDPDPAPGAPNGVSVRATNCFPIFAALGLFITDLQLTIEKDADIVADDILAMIETCPNLKELILTGMEFFCPVFRSIDADLVELSRLTYLQLEDFKGVENILLFIHAPSVQCFYLKYVDWTDGLSEALSRLFRTFHSIVEVEVWPDLYTSPDEQNYTPLFQGFPITMDTVKRFFVDGGPTSSPFLQQLSMPNAERLDLARAPFDVVRLVASSTTHLEHATFTKITACPPGPFPTISLPDLTSFCVEHSPDLLEHIRAPRLESIEVRGDYDGDMCMLTSLHDMVERSAPSALLSLSLSHVTVADENIIACLKRLPTLETLIIRRCSLSDRLLRALCAPTVAEEAEWLLPRLTKMELVENPNMTPAAVISLIKSRNGPSSHDGTLTPPRVKGQVAFPKSMKLRKREAHALYSSGDFSR